MKGDWGAFAPPPPAYMLKEALIWTSSRHITISVMNSEAIWQVNRNSPLRQNRDQLCQLLLPVFENTADAGTTDLHIHKKKSLCKENFMHARA